VAGGLSKIKVFKVEWFLPEYASSRGTKIWKSWSLPQKNFSLNYFKSETHIGRERRFQNEDGNIMLVTKPASQCTLTTCKFSPRNKNFKTKKNKYSQINKHIQKSSHL